MNKLGNYQSQVMTEEDRRRVYGLEFKFIYHQFFSEGAAFFFLCFYYLIEYTRLQTIYKWLDIIPWGLLAAVFAILFMPSDKYRQHPKSLLVFAVYIFILLIFLSMTYALDSQVAADRGYIYLNWLIVFFATISLVTTERRFAFFLLLYFLWNFKMSQHGAISWLQRGFSFAGWGVSGPSGWFTNSGEFGLQMAMICVISLCYFLATKSYLTGWRKWVVLSLPVTSFMTVMASSNRGDYLGLIAGLLWLALAAKGKRLRYGLLIMCILGVGYWAMPDQMKERFDVAGSQDDYTSYTRETRWKAAYETFSEHPIFGVGIGSWVSYYSSHYPREIGSEGWGLVHNSFLEVMAEQGGIGLVLMIIIFVGMFSLNKSTRNMASRNNNLIALWLSRGFDAATIAYLAGASFMTVFHYPYVWVQSAMIISLHVATKRNLIAFEKQKNNRSLA